MIGAVARLKIKEGKGAEYEKIASEMIATVSEKEPGTLLYRLIKLADDEYVAIETYADQAAVDAHVNSDHFQVLLAKLETVLAGPPEIRSGSVVAG